MLSAHCPSQESSAHAVLTGYGHTAGTRCRRWSRQYHRWGWGLCCRATPLFLPRLLCWDIYCSPPVEGTCNRALGKAYLQEASRSGESIWPPRIPPQQENGLCVAMMTVHFEDDQCKILTSHMSSCLVFELFLEGVNKQLWPLRNWTCPLFCPWFHLQGQLPCILHHDLCWHWFHILWRGKDKC